MKLEVNNLTALIQGKELNLYQRSLAVEEWYKLLNHVNEMEQALSLNIVEGQSVSPNDAKPMSAVSLPSIEEAGAAAVAIAENIQPNLSAAEQALFIAGFQECVKWLGYSGNDR